MPRLVDAMDCLKLGRAAFNGGTINKDAPKQCLAQLAGFNFVSPLQKVFLFHQNVLKKKLVKIELSAILFRFYVGVQNTSREYYTTKIQKSQD